MLAPPRYIDVATVATSDLSYPWDEWRIRDYYTTISASQFDRLDQLTNAANTGLTVATGEWIYHRFDSVNSDPTVLQFLEAAWAGVVHPAYCIYTETDDDQWRGPVREPLAVTLAIANDALFCLRDDPHIATRACWMYKLARHVLPSADAFDSWFERCVERLEGLHAKGLEPAKDADMFSDLPWQGQPVPREAFDPDVDYRPADAPALWDRFLRSLRPDANPYLRDPRELQDVDDLPGSPYRYLGRSY